MNYRQVPRTLSQWTRSPRMSHRMPWKWYIAAISGFTLLAQLDVRFMLIIWPILYVIPILGIYRQTKSLIDYRLAIISFYFLWCLERSLQVVQLGEELRRAAPSAIAVYLGAIICTGMLAMLFPPPKILAHGTLDWFGSEIRKLSIIEWLVIFGLVSSVFAAGATRITDGPVYFTLYNGLMGLTLLVYLCLSVIALTKGKMFGLLLILIPTAWMIIIYSTAAPNRTAVVFPLVELLFAAVAAVAFEKYKLRRLQAIFLVLALIATVLAGLVVGDIQKQSDVSGLDVIKFVSKHRDATDEILRENTYETSADRTIVYFNVIESVMRERDTFPGYVLMQLITWSIPREFWREKPEWDVTMLLHQDGVVPVPAFYEPFLQQWIDSRFAGVIAYNSLLFGWCLFLSTLVEKFRSRRGRHLSFGLYILSLPTAGFAARGLMVTMDLYLFFPTCLVIGILIAERVCRRQDQSSLQARNVR